jgi:hypothetical protein
MTSPGSVRLHESPLDVLDLNLEHHPLNSRVDAPPAAVPELLLVPEPRAVPDIDETDPPLPEPRLRPVGRPATVVSFDALYSMAGLSATSFDVTTAVAGVGIASFACVALCLPFSGLQLVGGLLVGVAAAGCGLMCWFDSGDTTVQAGLILTISMSVLAIFATLMIWSHFWHPVVLLFAIAIASGIACGARLALHRSGAGNAKHRRRKVRI